MRGDKEKFNLYLSGGLMRRFREMCFMKYGTTYGTVSFELENAMSVHLAVSKDQGSTHTHYGTKALDLNRRIIDSLKNKYQYETLSGVTIAKSMLDEAITSVDGCTDPRSINNRIRLLKSKGFIKESDDSNKLYKRFIFLVGEEQCIKKEELVTSKSNVPLPLAFKHSGF